MKTLNYKNILMTVLVAFWLSIAFAFGQNPNVTGKWKLNRSKSDIGDLDTLSFTTAIDISQSATSLIVKRTTEEDSGKFMSYTDSLDRKGSETQRAASAGQRKIMKLTLSPDLKTFAQNSVFRDPSGKVTKSVYSSYGLSEDGTSLTSMTNLSVNGENYTLKEVYDRQ